MSNDQTTQAHNVPSNVEETKEAVTYDAAVDVAEAIAEGEHDGVNFGENITYILQRVIKKARKEGGEDETENFLWRFVGGLDPFNSPAKKDLSKRSQLLYVSRAVGYERYEANTYPNMCVEIDNESVEQILDRQVIDLKSNEVVPLFETFATKAVVSGKDPLDRQVVKLKDQVKALNKRIRELEKENKALAENG